MKGVGTEQRGERGGGEGGKKRGATTQNGPNFAVFKKNPLRSQNLGVPPRPPPTETIRPVAQWSRSVAQWPQRGAHLWCCWFKSWFYSPIPVRTLLGLGRGFPVFNSFLSFVNERRLFSVYPFTRSILWNRCCMQGFQSWICICNNDILRIDF